MFFMDVVCCPLGPLSILGLPPLHGPPVLDFGGSAPLLRRFRLQLRNLRLELFQLRTEGRNGLRVGKDGFGGGSTNHAWSGGGLTILAQYVCGLYPLEPAWKSFSVKPQLGTLKFAETSKVTNMTAATHKPINQKRVRRI